MDKRIQSGIALAYWGFSVQTCVFFFLSPHIVWRGESERFTAMLRRLFQSPGGLLALGCITQTQDPSPRGDRGTVSTEEEEEEQEFVSVSTPCSSPCLWSREGEMSGGGI